MEETSPTMSSLNPMTGALGHALGLTPEHALREHGDWMARLVRRLVRDADRVDDVVQDAWAAALQNPAPEGVPLRAWLSGIVKRTAMARGRGDQRRKERERNVAATSGEGRSEARDVAELSACADEQRFLLEALRELPQGEQDVLLLRFYEDAPPREIARRLDVPVNTVRTRQRLGLQRLREQLDRRHAGDSSAWALALLPLGRFGLDGAARATAVAGGFAGGGATAASLGWLVKLGLASVVLIGAGAAIWWTRPPAGPDDLMQRVTPEEAVSMMGLSQPGAGQARASEVAAAELAERTAGERRPASTALNSATRLTANVVSIDGSPIGGAKVFRTATPRPRVYTGDIDPEWRTPDAVTDENGAFQLPAPEGETDDTEDVWVWIHHPDYFHRVKAQSLSKTGDTPIVLVPLRRASLEVRVADPTSAFEATVFSVRVHQERDPVAEGFPISFTPSERAKTTAGLIQMEVRYAIDRPLCVEVEGLAGIQGARDPESRTQSLRPDEQKVAPRAGEVTRLRFESELDEPETSGAYPVARGRVLDDKSGEPIVGALVSAAVILETPTPAPPKDLPKGSVWTPAPRNRVVASGQDGAFAVALPRSSARESAPVMATLTHPEYAAQTVPLKADSTGEVRLTKRGVLTVRAVDGEGEPIEDAAIGIQPWSGPSPWDGPSRWRASTNSKGEVELPRIPGGRYRVMLLRRLNGSDDDALAHSSVSVAPGESPSVTLRVNPPNLVHVTGPHWAPNPGADDARGPLIFLSYTDDGGIVQAGLTRNGFDAGGLARGTYLVAFTAATDKDDDPRLVSLVPNVVIEGVAAQSLQLQPGRSTITGRVSFSELDLPPGVHLRLTAAPTGVTGFAADTLAMIAREGKHWTPIDPVTGAFEVTGLVEGEHRLELRRSDTGEVVAERTLAVSGNLQLDAWKVRQ